jgi:hypothetical protein
VAAEAVTEYLLGLATLPALALVVVVLFPAPFNFDLRCGVCKQPWHLPRFLPWWLARPYKRVRWTWGHHRKHPEETAALRAKHRRS